MTGTPTTAPGGTTIDAFHGAIPASAPDTRRAGYTPASSPGTSYWGAYVPVDAAQVGVHPVRVLEPPHLIHAPVATAYYNQPIPIEARSNCATAACVGTLHWRTTGHAWNQTTM